MKPTLLTQPRVTGRAFTAILSLAAVTLLPQRVPAAEAAIPHLEKRGEVTQLIVDGGPFLILGGELLNNSATNLGYLKPVWPRMQKMHLNTVLAAVSWAQLEPEEGRFDFTILDGVVSQAREHDMRLVLLWFGSWKNTWSSYAPGWVKRDYSRFPRVQLASGPGTERLTPLSDANLQADARAFAAMMKHLRETDGDRHTVIMIQVENEVGVIPDARDHSPAADAAYNGAVPAELMEHLVAHRETLAPELRVKWQSAGSRTSGTWEEVFGADLETEDLFMAWHYAKYMGKVTEAGKKEYPLPMFPNAALIRPNYAPGQYNSGGPLPHSADLWRAGGPQFDFLSPDIYFEFKDWSDKFARNGNPLFIPEMAGGPMGAANVFYAIGHHAAIGVSPFGIDRGSGTDDDIGASYDILSQLAPLILKHQVDGNVGGAVLGDLTPSQKLRVGNFLLNLTKPTPRGPAPATARPDQPEPHGIFIATGPEEYYMAGSGLSVTFSPTSPGPGNVGLANVEEGNFVERTWVPGRTLAGDDTGQGNNVSLRGDGRILRVTVYRYP